MKYYDVVSAISLSNRAILCATTLATCAVFTGSAYATEVEVTPSSLEGWVIFPFVSGSFPLSNAPSGGFEAGPGTPPLGTGSYRAGVNDTGSKIIALQNDFDGLLLKDLQTLSYDTYQHADSTNDLTWYINLYIDTDANGEFDTRLDYQPAANSTTSESWQTFGAIDNGVYGSAWVIGQDTIGGQTVAGVFADQDAVVLNHWDLPNDPGGYGALAFNQGDTASTYVGANYSLDNIVVEFIGTDAISRTYNIEVPEPTSLALLAIGSLAMLRRRRS